MEIEIFEYEHDRAGRRFIVRGRAVRNNVDIEVVAAIADSDVSILNALNNGRTVKATVTEVIRLTILGPGRRAEAVGPDLPNESV